jgi:hypothetical protein
MRTSNQIGRPRQRSQFAALLAKAARACTAEGLFLLAVPPCGKRGEAWSLLCVATGKEVACYFPATRRLRVGSEMRQCANWHQAVEAAARLRALRLTNHG